MSRVPVPVDPPVSVQHRDGWCATHKKTTNYSDSIKTVCGNYVSLPWGIKRQWPDCQECCKRLGLKDEASQIELCRQWARELGFDLRRRPTKKV